MSRTRKLLFVLPPVLLPLALAACLGCTPAAERTGTAEPSPVTVEPYDYAMILALDVSGSMANLMKPGGKGLDLSNSVINHFFQARLGSNDMLTITQLSGNRQAVVWQGAPRQIREDFSRFSDLGDYVLKRSDGNGSRIWDGLSDSLELVMTDPRCWNDRTKVIVVALTDMENTLIDNYSSERRLKDNLKAFAKHGGIIALYYVGDQEVVKWRKSLLEAGFKPGHFVVAHRDESKPKIPSFE